ncbi:MAG: bifunctional chorismate mutase/prephenate dehydrogenase [Desulfobacterales bacterium]|nr:bifunctional chorismate mutase/prephenate dehydrogenase [Desulfobacterales bacterium]
MKKESVVNENSLQQGQDPNQVLNELRQQIDQIDQKIVGLLADRQHEVENIIQIKKAHRMSIYHPAREENLISDRRHQAQQAGLDPNYIEELFRFILRQSRFRQSTHMAQKGIHEGATVLIVGGKGEMGKYFVRWFEQAGYHVRTMGRRNWDNIESLCLNLDLALISVPIDVTSQVIQQLSPFLPKRCILADITSIKMEPLASMLEAHSGPVIGLHPLFGPSTSSMDKQIIVYTPGRDHQACQWLLDQLSTWGAVIVGSDAKEHDEIMAIVQSLRHFATFAFGQFLCRKQTDLYRSLEFSSPIYRLEIGMVGRLFAQDPALYSEIIFASTERRQLLKDYIASIASNLDMLDLGDKQEFCAEFSKIASWFGRFSEQAMRESTFLIDKLIERF